MTDHESTAWWREGAGPDEVVDSIFKRIGFEPRIGGLVRDLGDGREVHLVPQLYNYRISIGPAGGASWRDSW